MEEFDFQSNWLRMVTPPVSGTRCLVTDGDVIVIATYLVEADNNHVWIFSGLTEEDSKTFSVQAWMTLPNPAKKIILYEGNTNER